MGRERRREVLHPPALRPDAGQQEDRRAASARAAGRAGPARWRRSRRPTNDRPQSPWPLAPSSSTMRAEPLVQRAARPRPAARPRRDWRCGRARSSPAPASRAASISGSRASRPSSGLAVKASAPSPGTGPNGPGRLAHQRLGVGGGRDRHVAALAVGDHEQAVVARDRRRCARAPPSRARPRRSKQASWSLTATQAGPAATIAARQCSATASAVSARARSALARPGRALTPGQSAAGSGSSPSTTRLRRSSTSTASRSAKLQLRSPQSQGHVA